MERDKSDSRLKPVEYHTTVCEKMLAVTSGILIGGSIGIDFVFPGTGQALAASMFCLGVPVSILGWIKTENKKPGMTKSEE